MIAMSPTVSLKGSIKFSMKKMLAGGEMSSSTFTGPGELLLAPSMLGDISLLRLNGQEQWSVGKDAFLACTQGVVKDYKNQGLSKAFFSGEGLFVYKISGTGILFVQSFGAIIRKDVRFFPFRFSKGTSRADNINQTCSWSMAKSTLLTTAILYRGTASMLWNAVASGGVLSNLSSGEGLVCKFTGPGTIYLQTRNASAFASWMIANGAGGGGGA